MKPITIITICVICAATLMGGCMETTTTDEHGTDTYSILTEETVSDIDYYDDGFHITGTAVYDGDEMVSMACNIDGYSDDELHVTGTMSMGDYGEYSMRGNVNGYIDGCHITGTMSQIGEGDRCYDYHAKVDTYQSNGHHVTGYRTLKGCGDDVEWYQCLTATKDGYKTQYLNGFDDAEWRS